ncbi:alpha/beta hydrolase [Leucobacter sp. OH1287]|uniref:alpha/beta hydrolase n=1 Tax=Leucobacter sp. OH1287 TaxID=2491049 RepID=UPI000F5DFF47|nr:alpha/beta hydrolase [Leucobacter sp. OH1287]RRD60835.1 alpha/beta hydrolase [Leucobacter sp. OH1287]
MKRKIAAVFAAACALSVALSGCHLFVQEKRGDSQNALEDAFDGELPAFNSYEGYQSQKLKWAECDEYNLQCASIAAPDNWDEIGEKQSIQIALARLKSFSSKPRGSIFINPGGPGVSAIEFLENSNDLFTELLEEYDIVAWDPRGVGNSTPVDCLTDKELDDYIFSDPSETGEPGTEEWLSEIEQQNREYSEKCGENTDAPSGASQMDTVSTVKDLELLRIIVGDDKLNYLGMSYGTFIGALYADIFPEKVGHLVLDGAVDPTTSVLDVVKTQTLGFENALRNYFTACLAEDSCETFKGKSVDEALAGVSQILADLEAKPLRGSDGRFVGPEVAFTAIATPLYSQDSWFYLDMLFSSLQEGDPSVAFTLADFYYDREYGSYNNNSTEAFTVINCLDYPHEKPDLAAMQKNAEELAAVAPLFGKYQGYAEVSCWGWEGKSQDNRRSVTGAGADPILVVGTVGDPATPYEWAVSLAKQLESGVLVTFEGEGHVAYGSSACTTETVNDYFIRDVVPEDGVRCSD